MRKCFHPRRKNGLDPLSCIDYRVAGLAGAPVECGHSWRRKLGGSSFRGIGARQAREARGWTA